MKDVKINGRAVTLYDAEFPGERFHASFVAMSGYKMTGDFTHDIGPYCPFVDAWEFDGDPAEVENWAKLDYLKVIAPLLKEIRAIWAELNEQIEDDLDEGDPEKN